MNTLLINDLIEQIGTDIENEDVSAIEELIAKLLGLEDVYPLDGIEVKKLLLGFLSEKEN